MNATEIDAFNSKHTNVKHITHMRRRWDTSQNFCLVFINELKKQLFITLKTTINFEKKWKTLLEISSFYTKLPKTKITWGTVPEIWSTTGEIIFCHFTTLTTWKIKILKKWKKHQSCDHVYILRYECNRHEFLSFWAILCPFTPQLTPKIKIWNKCKKKLDILSYYTCVP